MLQTLFEYDTLNDYEKEVQKRDGVVKNTRNKLKNMQQGEMKETIEALLGQYDQEVTENTIGAINERDEWFSADHSELEELDVSMNKEEETELDCHKKGSIFNIVVGV
ncbi:hypothetical protein AM593_03556, partial [Mytilus galloprovincialis]